MVTQMIGVGEAPRPRHHAREDPDFYEEEVDTAVAGLLTLLEPVMIAFLAVLSAASSSRLPADLQLDQQADVGQQGVPATIDCPCHRPTCDGDSRGSSGFAPPSDALLARRTRQLTRPASSRSVRSSSSSARLRADAARALTSGSPRADSGWWTSSWPATRSSSRGVIAVTAASPATSRCSSSCRSSRPRCSSGGAAAHGRDLQWCHLCGVVLAQYGLVPGCPDTRARHPSPTSASLVAFYTVGHHPRLRGSRLLSGSLARVCDAPGAARAASANWPTSRH